MVVLPNLFINSILNCDALSGLSQLEDESVDTVMTSPPYYALRDYKVEGQIGLEPTFDLYIEHLMQVFNECKRVLKKTGSCWVVIGDTYNGSKTGNTQGTGKSWLHGNNTGKYLEDKVETKKAVAGIPDKSLLLIPERFAIKMIDNGWTLRNKIIWQKRNVIPSSAKDRYTVDYENIYFFTKSPKYYFETQYEPYSPETLKQFNQLYTGQATKDYESNNVQNPSDVKRSIIASLSKYPEGVGAMHYNTKISKRQQSRDLAKSLFPGDRKKQAEFIRGVHEMGGHVMKSVMPPIGGVKQAGGDNLTYSGNRPPWKFGRIKRTVWIINTKPFKGAHFAVFPEALVQEVINAACPINGVLLDPFMGAGTVALVALKMNRNFIGIELNKDYVDLAYTRIEPYLKQEKLFVNEVL